MLIPLTLPVSMYQRALSGSDVAIQMKSVDFRLEDDRRRLPYRQNRLPA